MNPVDIRATVDALNACGRHFPCRLCPYQEHRANLKCRDLLLIDCARVIFDDDTPLARLLVKAMELGERSEE